MRAARVGGLEGIDIEPVPVEAQAGDGSQPGTPRDLALGKDGGARLAHGVVADRVEALARAGLVQADVDAVVPPLQSYGVAQRQPAHARLPGPPQLAAGGAAPVGLLELVPVDRIVEEPGEVRQQVHAICEQPGPRSDATVSEVAPLARPQVRPPRLPATGARLPH